MRQANTRIWVIAEQGTGLGEKIRRSILSPYLDDEHEVDGQVHFRFKYEAQDEDQRQEMAYQIRRIFYDLIEDLGVAASVIGPAEVSDAMQIGKE